MNSNPVVAGTLFTGGGGVDLGLRAAGVVTAWGIELDTEIAAVAQANGVPLQVADILEADPRDLQRVDILHASPPCPNFSNAKPGARETPHDIALARQIAAFIRVLRPRIFTLENVFYYRRSRSFAIIISALNTLGYFHHYTNVNAADFGVPQTRRRLILRAIRHGLLAPLPQPEPWRGWYQAIADLLPELPDSEFAPWQLKQFHLCANMLLPSNGGKDSLAGRAHDEPAHTVVPNAGGRARAFIADDQYSGQPGGMRVPTLRFDDEPIFTVTATQTKRSLRAMLESGRVVAMTPRALARFQSFPDSYALPENNRLACRVIGNAVPPLLYQKIMEGLLLQILPPQRR